MDINRQKKIWEQTGEQAIRQALGLEPGDSIRRRPLTPREEAVWDRPRWPRLRHASAAAQRLWLAALEASGAETMVARPCDWSDGTIEQHLSD
jgi:hypothetical protein